MTVIDHRRGTADESDDELSIEDWLRSRPPSVKRLVRRFPPFCVVRANRPLICPMPGTLGLVVSLFEDGKRVGVIQLAEGESWAVALLQAMDDLGMDPIRAQCLSDWLDVVRYWNDWTPERVAAVLAGDAS
jgi:hypothetical protein